jgi:hypothetical protein
MITIDQLARGLTLAFGLLPLGSALAAPHIVDIRWDESGHFAHKAEVPAGQFVEVCGALEKGRSVKWSFQSSEALNFNIHYHMGQETHYPVKLAAVRAADRTFRVEAEQPHCWMWSNTGRTAARLDVMLRNAP